MDDLISRQAVLDWLEKDWDGMVVHLFDGVKKIPSAQPEKRTQERTKTHACDLISRQAAIDAISCDITITGRQNAELVAATIGAFADRIKALPSVQPEIIRCRDCKHNPKDTWFGCPMSHLSEKQRPDDAWCWKGERRTDG